MSRRRKAAGSVGLAALLAVSALWFINTESLGFPYQDDAIRLAPGETAEIDVGPCQPPSRVLYRPSLFGRWQETHANGEKDIRRWWELGRRSYTAPSICIPGPMVVGVPDDLVSDHLAICGLGTGNCVEIIVERAH